MRKLAAFNNLTLDGCFSGEDGDISWFKGHTDPEFSTFVADNASSGGALLLGRITYGVMASYWPTPLAAASDPVVAEGMNRMPKYVASRTLAKPGWEKSTVLEGELASAVRKLKSQSGPNLTILGSGSIIAQLAGAGLIDEYQIVVNPLFLGRGKTIFDGIAKPLPLKLTNARTFGNGNVFLSYEPAR